MDTKNFYEDLNWLLQHRGELTSEQVILRWSKRWNRTHANSRIYSYVLVNKLVFFLETAFLSGTFETLAVPDKPKPAVLIELVSNSHLGDLLLFDPETRVIRYKPGVPTAVIRGVSDHIREQSPRGDLIID